MNGIPRFPKCEEAACNLPSGHLGEHEIRPTFAEERQRNVQRWVRAKRGRLGGTESRLTAGAENAHREPNQRTGISGACG